MAKEFGIVRHTFNLSFSGSVKVIPHIDTDKNASRVRDLLNRHSFEDQGWINSWSKLSSSTSNFSREVLPDGHEPSPNAPCSY